MDALKDIWASLVNGVRERTTNPLSFAFLLSWSAWNFKFFVVLLGEGTSATRLSSIDAMYPIAWSTYLGGALLYPLLTAAAYVFLYPFISAKAISFYREKQVQIANSVKGIEEKRLLTPEEVAERTRRHESERRAWEEAESALESQLREVRDALDAAEKQINEMRPIGKAQVFPTSMGDQPVAQPYGEEEEVEEEVVTADATIGSTSKASKGPVGEVPTPTMLKLLLKISEGPTGLSASDLSKLVSQNFTVVEAMLDDMRNLQLVTKATSGRWQLASKGKSLVVDMIGARGNG